MKIIHTADLHLGKVFHQYTRLDEQAHFLDFLLHTLTEEQADVLIVAGDVFDTPNPSADAQRLWYDFLVRATQQNDGLQIVVIAGNHDSGARLESAAQMARHHRVHLVGTLPTTASGNPDPAQLIVPLYRRLASEPSALCFAIPFLRSAQLPLGQHPEEGMRQLVEAMEQWQRKSDYAALPTLAVAHLYLTGAQISEIDPSERLAVGGQDAVSASIFPDHFAYVALGHIHKAQKIGTRECVRYSGAPLKFSFGERNYQLGVNLVELAEGDTHIRRIDYAAPCELITLPEKGVASPDEALSLLRDFPDQKGESKQNFAPFVELRVKLAQPEPELRHRLLELAATKELRLCRIVATTDAAPRGNLEAPQKLEQAAQLSPFDLAAQFFEERYGEPMSEALKTRFLTAQNSIEE